MFKITEIYNLFILVYYNWSLASRLESGPCLRGFMSIAFLSLVQ